MVEIDIWFCVNWKGTMASYSFNRDTGSEETFGVVPPPKNKLLNLDSEFQKYSTASTFPNLISRGNVPSNLRSMYRKGMIWSTGFYSHFSDSKESSLLFKVDFKHPASKNWLIHMHYVRKEFDICKAIIHEELQRLNGNSEYPNYILVRLKLI